MEHDLSDFMCFRTSNTQYDMNNSADPIAQNTQRLVQKIEELEDLVIELKSKQSANDLVELKQLVSELQLQSGHYQTKIDALS